MLILNAPNDLWKIAHLPAYVQDSAASDLKYNHCVILLESREETKCLISKELRASCCLPPKGQIIFSRPAESFMQCSVGGTVFYIPFAFTDLFDCARTP